MESRRKRGSGLFDKMKTELVDKMSGGAGGAESIRATVSHFQQDGELSRSSDKNRKKKKKSKQLKEGKKRDAKTFSGSFADYLTHLQEGKEERDHRELNERVKKAAALKAKKKAELDSALSFIDGQLQSGSDFSDDEEEEKRPRVKEEESIVQWVQNYKSESGEKSGNWASELVWGEIKGQEQQISEPHQAPATISSTRRDESLAEQVFEDIPGGKVHSRVKMEEDFEDKVTQDMCSTSVSTDAKPQVIKMEGIQDVREKKISLFVQSGAKKFQVSLQGEKRVKKVRAAVAGQLKVETHRVELQVIFRYSLVENYLI